MLSEVLRDILAGDPITPVLHEPYYAAMDRRLTKALETIQKCIAKYSEDAVLIDDGYSWFWTQYSLFLRVLSGLGNSGIASEIM